MGNATAYWIRLGGTTPATEIAPHTPPTWETWADGGNGPSSFELGRSAKSAPHLTTPGTLLEIFKGCGRMWLGRIEDYDPNDGSVVGRGIHTDLFGIPALDSLGATTRVADTAITTARGAPWNLRVNDAYAVLPAMGTAKGDDTSPQMVNVLLDQCAEQAGKRWGQDANASLYFRADASVAPSWLLAPGVARFGTTTEGRVSHLIGRYQTSTGDNATVTRVDPDATVLNAETVDLTERGALTEAEVISILDAALAAVKSETRWINGITVTRDQLMTIGGTPASLAGVRAGGRVNVVELGMNRSAILGKTKYTAGESVIYVEPANTAPRTFADVLAAS